MLSLFAKLALVVTTIAPIGFTFSFLLMVEQKHSLSAIAFFSSILLSSICMKIIEIGTKKLNKTHVTVVSFKPADKEVSGYFVAYMLPVMAGGGYFVNVYTAIFFTAMFFVFIWASKSFYSNPMLAFFGYGFYEIQATSGACYLLITKKKIKCNGDVNHVAFLTDYTLIDLD